MNARHFSGWFPDFERHCFFYGEMTVEGDRIGEIRETGTTRVTWEGRDRMDRMILPGLVDAHVHIESSMLMPTRFAECAVRFGTVATVSDPHEIANVLGLEGIRFLAEDAAEACMGIHLTAPSCVPATSLESAGARLEAGDLEVLFRNKEVVALGEMMNYPGVIGGDTRVMEKIEMARRYGLPVDGHAPGLVGDDLEKYAAAGIQTDHECSTLEEGENKIATGMKVLIREGSSARNFENLWPLVDRYPDDVMFCTDDFHPDDLVQGHIDRLIRRGLEKGLDFFNLYRAASLNAIRFYGLSEGRLQPGDRADFIVASSLNPFRVEATYINGQCVFGDGQITVGHPEIRPVNRFNARPVKPSEFEVRGENGKFHVIRVYDGELVTGAETADMTASGGVVNGDPGRDLLKIAVINRYHPAKPAVAWITGFGLKRGALASSIAHDSHNIITVGAGDREMAAAVNAIIENRGGIATCIDGITEILPLPVAGLISTETAEAAGARYAQLSQRAKDAGSTLKAPFMALSFMALLVIPHLKIGDRGLFNCDTFEFTDIRADN